jgi:hypothetical protein
MQILHRLPLPILNMNVMGGIEEDDEPCAATDDV